MLLVRHCSRTVSPGFVDPASCALFISCMKLWAVPLVPALPLANDRFDVFSADSGCLASSSNVWWTCSPVRSMLFAAASLPNAVRTSA